MCVKIAIDARSVSHHRGTGLGTYAYQLIRHINMAGVKLRLFWPGEQYNKLKIENEEDFRIMEQYQDNYWQEVYLPEALLRDNISLFHVPQNGIGLPRSKVCKYIVTIHDLIPYVYPEMTGKNYLKKFYSEMPFIMENTDHIITVSEWSKKDIIRIFGIPEERITVIYEAAEPQYVPIPKAITKTYLREKYSLNKPYILYIGGFSPRKNLSGLINAFVQVATNDPDVTLCLPGKRDKEQDVTISLIEAFGLSKRVNLLGFVPNRDLPYLYSGAELFVYPSFYEGFGLPPLEAMACGIPVLSSNASCLPEIVGKDGMYFNPHNTLEIAEKILLVLGDQELRHKLVRRGQRHIRSFSWQKTAEETISLYNKLLKT